MNLHNDSCKKHKRNGCIILLWEKKQSREQNKKLKISV